MTAKAGRGCYNFADDNSTDLSGQVISALNKASQPSLKDCSYSFFGQEVKLGEVFRDQLVQSYQIVSKAEFEKAKVNFKSAMDPMTHHKMELKFSRSDFEEANDMPLFKIAAHERLTNSRSQAVEEKFDRVKYSVKYQVLAKETAMVGVVKQKTKSVGELAVHTIVMGRSAI